MESDSRVALVGAAVLVVALALAAAPAAADDDDDDIGVATGDGRNSTIDLSASGNLSGQSGSGSIDCEGQPTHHECDKGGSADTSAGSVDYTGDNYGNDSSQRYGGGDEVTVASGGERVTVEFDCASQTTPGGDDCTVNVTSSQGDAPGPLGESDGDDEDDADDVPGSASAEVGVADGEGLNSTLAAGYEGETEDGSSEGAVDCVGRPTHHSCDKGGELTFGPLSVDYVGDNYADDDDQRFGGGDRFVVVGGGQQLRVGFDCAFDTSPSEETCDVDIGSSQGDAPGQGPEEDDEPGDERSEAGEENGEDDENRDGNAR
ncbi:putative sodium/potassium/calcium exchanger [Haloglomus irregulare]|jgi:hypothetical protein|uniref:hypothetical protein n=1 Tax=Haloglomus irregulare TaxID=2234134 RepID=UPI0011870127|nr:hypothetical protein [Haloglomus irregulare]